MPSRAMVSYDGNVFWPPPTKFRSTCSVDVTYFPFDDQVCFLKLGSWTYNGFQVCFLLLCANKLEIESVNRNLRSTKLHRDIK
jgi:hypothetical protein